MPQGPHVALRASSQAGSARVPPVDGGMPVNGACALSAARAVSAVAFAARRSRDGPGACGQPHERARVCRWGRWNVRHGPAAAVVTFPIALPQLEHHQRHDPTSTPLPTRDSSRSSAWGRSLLSGIIEGRPFRSVGDLIQVRGIGQVTLERMRPFVRVSLRRGTASPGDQNSRTS